MASLLVNAHYEHGLIAAQAAKANQGYHDYMADPVVKEEVEWALERLLRAFPESPWPMEKVYLIRLANDRDSQYALLREYAELGFGYSMAIVCNNAMGTDDEAEAQRVVGYLEKLVAQGNHSFRVGLGNRLEYGLGVEADPARAFQLYRDEATREGSLSHAKHRLGLAYLNGVGVAPDLKEAQRWFRVAAQAGFYPARYELAELLLRDRTPENLREAVALLEVLTYKGYLRGTVLLGRVVETGLTGKKESVRAERLYKSVELLVNKRRAPSRKLLANEWRPYSPKVGYARACFHVGRDLAQDTSKIVRHQKALPWLKRAAKRGVAPALRLLSRIYSHPRGYLLGVPTDLAEAWTQLERAELLTAGGPIDLRGFEALRAQGAPGEFSGVDERMAWVRELASKGVTAGLRGAARLYEAGVQGFPHSPDESQRLLQEALRAGDPMAKATLEGLRKRQAQGRAPEILSSTRADASAGRAASAALVRAPSGHHRAAVEPPPIPATTRSRREAVPEEGAVLLKEARHRWRLAGDSVERRQAALDKGEEACTRGANEACAWTYDKFIQYEKTRGTMTMVKFLWARNLVRTGGLRGDPACLAKTGLSFLGAHDAWPRPEDRPKPDIESMHHWLSAAVHKGEDIWAPRILRIYKLEVVPEDQIVLEGDTSGGRGPGDRSWLRR